MANNLIAMHLRSSMNEWKLPAKVCFSVDANNTEDYSAEAFLTAIAVCCNDLRNLDEQAGAPKRLVLFQTNSFYFSAAFLAANICGYELVLPANIQPEYLRQLNLLDAIYWVPDENVAELSSVLSAQVVGMHGLLDRFPENLMDRSCLSEALNKQAIITLFTSGSTGLPSSIKKTFTDLSNEVLLLESTFSPCDASLCYATVSHQHIYGLLFRLLWPLLSGRIFQDINTQYPEAVFASVSLASESGLKSLLVSSPAQLSRWVKHSDAALLNQQFTALYSSGGPLADNDAHAVNDIFDIAATEVYGSTETGGIAWRKRSGANAHAKQWRLFDGLSISTDENSCLRVQSPFIEQHYCDADGYFQTQDKVCISSPGVFELQGRVDRVIKLEEKRLSLDAMESWLQQSMLVTEAKLLVIEQAGKRSNLACVAVLSCEGQEKLNALGKKSLVSLLKQYVKGAFEQVLIPRKWRFISELPVNEQGKLTQLSLAQLFEKTDSNKHIINMLRLPGRKGLGEFAEQALMYANDNEVASSIKLPEEDPFFDAHYNEIGVLPGVVQIDWAVQLSACWVAPENFMGLRRFKFKAPVLPGTQVKLLVERVNKLTGKSGEIDERSIQVIKFSYVLISNEEQQPKMFSSGQLLFGVPEGKAVRAVEQKVVDVIDV